MRSDVLLGVFRGCGLFALGIALALPLCAVDVKSLPKPTGYVSDLAHVVSPSDKDQLEAFAARVEQELGVQFALVTVDTVGDQPIRDFALDLSRAWGVGDRKTNQGVVLVLAIKDHKSDIETGRGIEPYLTDGFSGSTLRSMRPQLRNGEYGPALLTAAQTMADQIARGKGISFSSGAPPPPEERPHDVATNDRGNWLPFPLILFGIFFLIWLLGRGGRRGGGGGGGGGFLAGMLLGNLLGGGRRYGGGGWGDGGGFGGGSGGGGGFGGFGGGDFGGGGASSDW